ncbi:sensor histidine kinase [Kribbella capetownensis]|uniref:histidine kinase n=1 Tax=Kribbella capetownensis TaxID=1572659 RepID=A0A4V2M6L5_9ACTN|nr:sensor histidine kinase [Kribbella capetownensis]TCC44162.1 sensor histidine kinase [Kribbella capetownensis]
MTVEQQVLGPWPRGRWAWVAGLGVAALVVLTVMDLGQHYDVPLGAVLALGLARGLGLALAWPRPRAALVVSLVVTAITAAATTPVSADEPWPWAVTAVFGYSFVLAITGARAIGRRELVGWWAVAQVVGLVAALLSPDRARWPGLLTAAVLTAIAVVVADLLRSRAETSRRLVEQEGISKTERAERARLQERARIARELHDVVAHHLSVVVVRADSAPHRLQDLPDDVQQEFAAIADDARSSLTEMRRVLRLLRDQPLEQPPIGELGPQPGLEQLEELVASTRRAGADVQLESAIPDGLDPAVELTAYRVIQEALSNAVRHAPEAAIRVKVRRSGGDLAIRVWNSPGTAQPTPGSGHGLVGMRERVALVDGVVSTGATPEGGYLVEVALPVGEVVASGDQGAGGR